MNQNKCFFGSLTYGATGEGLTFVVAQVIALDQKEAARKFISQHLAGEWGNKPENIERTVEFWSYGLRLVELDCNEGADEKIREMTKDFLNTKTVEYLIEANKSHGLMEFYFKSYVNFS